MERKFFLKNSMSALGLLFAAQFIQKVRRDYIYLLPALFTFYKNDPFIIKFFFIA
jgi:hypothetical protein